MAKKIFTATEVMALPEIKADLQLVKTILNQKADLELFRTLNDRVAKLEQRIAVLER